MIKNHLLRFIRLPEVLHRTGLSRTTVYRLMDSDEFPRQIPLGSRIVVWNEKEIEQWMKEKLRG
ncbi:helix-turn-helix transcriptional regulator [Prochlorococcus marinus]|uniref:helix-turn-helix transcriptional regulator n=1 Tax=Prochlorococcus marinus TaxID=1219 RepID=UPI0022B50DD7|nr:AlpA family transcriptional regulator [Prochlorococcus marinus]